MRAERSSPASAGIDGFRVSLVHDYLTQRGGAERVVLSMLKAFPGAPLYTSIFNPEATFPEFRSADVRVLALNRVSAFRHDHRRALPFLSAAFAGLSVDADVVVCSSSGWAHGVNARGAKVVYCHNPARWLYQREQYLGHGQSMRRAGLAVLRDHLLQRDQHAAATAQHYVANSAVVRSRVREAYGREAEVLHPPPALSPAGPRRAPGAIAPGYFLCVSRLLPYKNVGAICGAFERLPDERLVVVGEGPSRESLERRAPSSVRFVGRVADEELRWLYANCRGLVAASFEDFGLTPLEAGAFGKPVAAMRWGGYLDTVAEGKTGLFFERPTPHEIATAVRRLMVRGWREQDITAHADTFSERRFVARLREIAFAHATRREPQVIPVERRCRARESGAVRGSRGEPRGGPAMPTPTFAGASATLAAVPSAPANGEQQPVRRRRFVRRGIRAGGRA